MTGPKDAHGPDTGTTTAEEPSTPLSVRVVDRFGRALGKSKGFSRRGFLGRTAIVASALAINPFQYVLRPVSAYDSVCGEGASCSSGWTAFCCTVSGGANTCPSGSFVAGWWKIDASPFCRDAPRYIIDCNRSPGASCSCRCADDPCDTRRVCCNVFRYGQCNTHIGGVTEVVCRVVTCTPPWEWDPACSRTVRTDNRTVSHNSRCLPREYPSHIEIRYQDLGLVGSFLGAPDGAETDAARGGRYRRYEGGSIYWHPDTGAHVVRQAADAEYRDLGGTAGPLGFPRTDHRSVGPDGELVRFERGTIYAFEGTGTHGVTGRSDGRYRQLDGHEGILGRPVRSTTGSERDWRVTRFENGRIHESPQGSGVELHGAILDRFEELGGVGGSGLGHATARPARSDGLQSQRFEHGLIAGPDAGAVHAVRGPIAHRYLEQGGPDGDWGVPVASQTPVGGTDGEVAEFAETTAYHSPGTGVHVLTGAVLARFLEEGGPEGELGFPTTDVFTDRVGRTRASFEGGAVVAEGEGEARVLRPRSTRTQSEVPTGDRAPASRRSSRSVDELPGR